MVATALVILHIERQLAEQDTADAPFAGVAARVAQRLLAMAAAIWHNDETGAPVTRSLIAYDH